MIRTLAPGQYRDTLPVTDLLVGDDLAWVGLAFTLRVTGWSMFPTLRQGDVLRLLPANAAEPGDLVLFRHDRRLVCHRVISAMSEDVVRTRGDAARGDGELVQRKDLVGKVAEIVRGGTFIDPREFPAATIVARIGRSIRGTVVAAREALIEASSRLLRACLRTSLVRHAARRFLTRSLSYALGSPAPVQLVRAYQFVELGRRPIDQDSAGTALRSLPSLSEAIVLARLGRVPLGTMAVRSGEVQIRRAGAGLGIEEALRAMVQELAALESALGR